MPKIHCSRHTPSQGLNTRSLSTQKQWGPSGNTGEVKVARKGTGHPTSQSRWLRTSVLSNRHSSIYGLYMGLTYILHILHIYHILHILRIYHIFHILHILYYIMYIISCYIYYIILHILHILHTLHITYITNYTLKVDLVCLIRKAFVFWWELTFA